MSNSALITVLLKLKHRKNTVFALYSISICLKISCLFLMESSHSIVESSRYNLRDRSYMRTREINLNSGAVMAPINLTTLKSVPLMVERF